MSGTVQLRTRQEAPRRQRLTEPRAVRWLLTAVVLAFLGVFLVLPLVVVCAEAFSKGWSAYASAITDPYAIAALELTLLAAAIALPANLLFGICAGWTIARFDFRGKDLLTTLIDLPF